MARPRSEDKQDAILAAAIALIAERGLNATPTSAISKAANVAEGSLFTYFKTKEQLVNRLYLELKRELAGVLLEDFPERGDARSQFRHVWDRYADWGVANPDKKKVMDQLNVSGQISAESRAIGAAPFAALETIVKTNIAARVLRDLPVALVVGAMGSLVEMTIGFMVQYPEQAQEYRTQGFELLWNGIAC